MAAKSKVAVLDSSALISLVNVADTLHHDAARLNTLITTDD